MYDNIDNNIDYILIDYYFLFIQYFTVYLKLSQKRYFFEHVLNKNIREIAAPAVKKCNNNKKM